MVLLCGLLGACSSDPDSEFTYGKADMEGAIVGTWTGQWVPEGAPRSELTLVVQRPPMDSLDPQCSNRVFSSQSQSGLHFACAAVSSLRLVGDLSVADGSIAEPSLSGELSISSRNLGPGDLTLTNPDGTFTLRAVQRDAASFESCEVRTADRDVICTLDSRH